MYVKYLGKSFLQILLKKKEKSLMEICFLGQNLFRDILAKIGIYYNKNLFNYSFIFLLGEFW